jgi:hypothetical protein
MKKYIIITTISILLSTVVFSIGFITGDLNRRSVNTSQDWTDIGANIDTEYYLEVSQDSIWIENYSTHKVYGGKYSNLDSLINLDNL